MECLLMPKIMVQYFAVLREQRGQTEDEMATVSETPAQLYRELQNFHAFTLPSSALRVAINDEFASMDAELHDGDVVAFIAPVAGG
jgi:molybdopterin converting factor subunit 1